MQTSDLDRLVRTITELVLARLRDGSRPTREAQTLTVLWPAPTSATEAILAGVEVYRADGRQVRWLVRPELVGELTPRLPEEERPRCHPLDKAPLQSILADLQGSDVVLLAAAHFEAARRLLALDDELAWVQILLQAQLLGQPILVCDDLLTVREAAAQGPVAEEARGLARRLRQAGYRLLPARELPRYLKDLTRAGGLGLQDAPGLVTEKDVEDLARAGHRRLHLRPGTLVTPLARGRAAELGLELSLQE